MEDKKWNEEEMIEKEHNVWEEDVESRLHAAVHRIVPDEPARERIIEGVKAGKRNRRRLAPRVPAAVLAVCLLLSLLCFARPGFVGEEVVVYAATEEYGWQKLMEGERILLKKQPYDTTEGGDSMEHLDNMEQAYYPYKCTFRLELPENYLYDRQFITLRDDFITERGGIIEWKVAQDRPEDTGRISQGNLSLWIVNEKRERIAAMEVELTKENGECYAELKCVWESEAYRKRKVRR